MIEVCPLDLKFEKIYLDLKEAYEEQTELENIKYHVCYQHVWMIEVSVCVIIYLIFSI